VAENILEIGFDSLNTKYERMRLRIPSKESKLLSSLGEFGQQTPIVVVHGSEPRQYIVIDGLKRVRCLKKLKADIVKAVVWDMKEPQALMMIYQITSGGHNLFEESWLIHELNVVWGFSIAQLSIAFGRTGSWVSRKLGIVSELPEWMHNEIRNGRIGEYVAARYLLPLARANSSDCEKLTKNISGKNLSSRQVGELYEHYKSSSRRVREQIISHPVKFLKAKAQADKSVMELEFSDAENRCLKNLELIGKISTGLADSLSKAVNYDTCDAMKQRLKKTWRYVQNRIDRLSDVVNFILSESEKLNNE